MENFESDTTKITTLCGKMYVTQCYDENGRHCNVFLSGMGKAGGCSAAQHQAVARLITYCFELGGTYMGVAKCLKGIQCNEPFTDKGLRFKSCMDAAGYLFEEKREEADREAEKEEV